MGSKITLQTSFSAPTGKTLGIDAVMPPVQGAILLLDGSHSLGGFGTGLPSIGAKLKNVAWEQAASMLGGSPTQDDLSPTFENGASGGNNTTAERTTKGGLHVAARQTVQTASHGKRVSLSASLMTLLTAKKDDDIYLSVWAETTRAPSSISINPPLAILANAASASANYISAIRVAAANDFPSSGSGKRIGARISPDSQVAGRAMRNIATSDSTGSVTSMLATFILWGSATTYDLSPTPANAPSFILYRAYIEDLTVSGRTYAEVDALDQALFTKEFGVGGKFYGDTWTAPSTLAGT